MYRLSRPGRLCELFPQHELCRLPLVTSEFQDCRNEETGDLVKVSTDRLARSWKLRLATGAYCGPLNRCVSRIVLRDEGFVFVPRD
jgi:hypothetical protein